MSEPGVNGSTSTQAARRAAYEEPRDPSGTYLWCWILGMWLVSYLVLLCIPVRYDPAAVLYLLSALAQCLSAVLALTLTLPLAFATLSGYVLDEAHRMVRHRVYVSYAMLYAATVMFSLVLLRVRRPADWVLDMAVALATACLTSLWLFARWTAGRLQPVNYIRRLLARLYALCTVPDDAKEPLGVWICRVARVPIRSLWLLRAVGKRHALLSDATIADRLEAASQAAHIARLAIRNGALRYWDLVLDGLLRFLVLGELGGSRRLVVTARKALELIMPTLVADEASFESAMTMVRDQFVILDASDIPLQSVSSYVGSLTSMLDPVLDAERLDDRKWSLAYAALWTLGMVTASSDNSPAALVLGKYLREKSTTARQYLVARWARERPAVQSGVWDEESRSWLRDLTQQAKHSAITYACALKPTRRTEYESRADRFARIVLQGPGSLRDASRSSGDASHHPDGLTACADGSRAAQRPFAEFALSQ